MERHKTEAAVLALVIGTIAGLLGAKTKHPVLLWASGYFIGFGICLLN